MAEKIVFGYTVIMQQFQYSEEEPEQVLIERRSASSTV